MYFFLTNNSEYPFRQKEEVNIIYSTHEEKAFLHISHVLNDADIDKDEALEKIKEVMYNNYDHFLIVTEDGEITLFEDWDEEKPFETENLYATYEGVCGALAVIGETFYSYDEYLRALRTCEEKIMQILAGKHDKFKLRKIATMQEGHEVEEVDV